jgi:hypothetical protein
MEQELLFWLLCQNGHIDAAREILQSKHDFVYLFPKLLAETFGLETLTYVGNFSSAKFLNKSNMVCQYSNKYHVGTLWSEKEIIDYVIFAPNTEDLMKKCFNLLYEKQLFADTHNQQYFILRACFANGCRFDIDFMKKYIESFPCDKHVDLMYYFLENLMVYHKNFKPTIEATISFFVYCQEFIPAQKLFDQIVKHTSSTLLTNFCNPDEFIELCEKFEIEFNYAFKYDINSLVVKYHGRYMSENFFKFALDRGLDFTSKEVVSYLLSNTSAEKYIKILKMYIDAGGYDPFIHDVIIATQFSKWVDSKLFDDVIELGFDFENFTKKLINDEYDVTFDKFYVGKLIADRMLELISESQTERSSGRDTLFPICEAKGNSECDEHSKNLKILNLCIKADRFDKFDNLIRNIPREGAIRLLTSDSILTTIGLKMLDYLDFDLEPYDILICLVSPWQADITAKFRLRVFKAVIDYNLCTGVDKIKFILSWCQNDSSVESWGLMYETFDLDEQKIALMYFLSISSSHSAFINTLINYCLSHGSVQFSDCVGEVKDVLAKKNATDRFDLDPVLINLITTQTALTKSELKIGKQEIDFNKLADDVSEENLLLILNMLSSSYYFDYDYDVFNNNVKTNLEAHIQAGLFKSEHVKLLLNNMPSDKQFCDEILRMCTSHGITFDVAECQLFSKIDSWCSNKDVVDFVLRENKLIF